MRFTNLRLTTLAAISTIVLAAATANAGTVYKANNTSNLNVAASWTGGMVPTSADTAVLEQHGHGAVNSVSMGGDLAWYGLQLVNPGGPS